MLTSRILQAVGIAINLGLVLAVSAIIEGPEGVRLAIDPITALAIGSAIASGVGALRRRNQPDPPDFTAEAANEGYRARQRVLETQTDTLRSLDDQQRSQGIQGTGLQEEVIQESSRSLADIDAAIADSVAAASNRTKTAEYNQRLARNQATNQSIGTLLQAATMLAQARSATADFNPTEGITDQTTTPTATLNDYLLPGLGAPEMTPTNPLGDIVPYS